MIYPNNTSHKNVSIATENILQLDHMKYLYLLQNSIAF